MFKRAATAIALLALVAPCFGQSITLAWDPVTDANLGGYRLYCGTASRTYTSSIDVLKVTTYKVTAPACGLVCGKRYFFAVTAYSNDAVPSESAYSNEVNEALICAPANLKITSTSVSEIQRKEATILAQTSLPATMVIEWTGPEGIRKATVDYLYRTDHTITLVQLRPHSSYTYRLTAYGTDGTIDVAVGSFTTQ